MFSFFLFNILVSLFLFITNATALTAGDIIFPFFFTDVVFSYIALATFIYA